MLKRRCRDHKMMIFLLQVWMPSYDKENNQFTLLKLIFFFSRHITCIMNDHPATKQLGMGQEITKEFRQLKIVLYRIDIII